MRVRVLFFGMLKDMVGRAEESLEMPEESRATDVLQHYAAQLPQLAGMQSSIVLARNHEFTLGDIPIQDGDEIALLPPVSGGASPWLHEIADPAGHFFALTRHPIDAAALSSLLLRDEDGAVVQFDGVVRNNTKGRATRYLEYECYEAMAIKVMAEIGRDIATAHSIGRIALVHRLGRMDIGESSVVVIATAPHRRPAFEAALEGINRLKKLVPIWKKEFFADGEVWVEGEWDNSVRPA